MKGWLDSLSFPMLVVLALLLGLAPFSSEPHLLEKLKMLFASALQEPMDIFDLFLHASGILLLGLRLLSKHLGSS
ncbi:MAG: hypothetical protein BMS9Abin36_1400 [Gammaproteobacteria bacterium]|nr:MAG: hypothetical protein BMS9Abin36_1400 [Gammaproteobacteria bacterium]